MRASLLGLMVSLILGIASCGQIGSFQINTHQLHICYEDFLEHPDLGFQEPDIFIGCEVIDCCPGCPGSPWRIEWYVEIVDPVFESFALVPVDLLEDPHALELKGFEYVKGQFHLKGNKGSIAGFLFKDPGRSGWLKPIARLRPGHQKVGTYRINIEQRLMGSSTIIRRDALRYISKPCKAPQVQPLANLRVYLIDAGKNSEGDCTLIISPTGKTMVVDCANGTAATNVAEFLSVNGVSDIHWSVATHYHNDHIAGFDNLLGTASSNYPTSPTIAAYDRGGVPDPESCGTSAFPSYEGAVADNNRTTITPGTVIDMGGGVTVTCIIADGTYLASSSGTGTAGVDLSSYGCSFRENAKSVGLRIEYGNFDLWLGGDLYGATSDKYPDEESLIASIVGDLDVYKAHHHGNATSTNATWVGTVMPEVSVTSYKIVPIGDTPDVPDRQVLANLNPPARSTIVMGRTRGAGYVGQVNAQGTISIFTNGETYTVFPHIGAPIQILCDEFVGETPQLGDLKLSEFLANPGAVADELGEWFEIVNVSATTKSLHNLRVGDGAGVDFTFAPGVLLHPGCRFVFGRNGDPTPPPGSTTSTNGGYTPGTVWPVSLSGDVLSSEYNLVNLTNGGDSMVLLNVDGEAIDVVDYSTWGDPTPSGYSLKRVNLVGPSEEDNFSPSTETFGEGDHGTPGG